ncbi:MAG: hypothetical protein MZV64_11880 [Ignavibacteriales bacterium]|nr:hypothetical protein [Ignavibacteriales bacterium]
MSRSPGRVTVSYRRRHCVMLTNVVLECPHEQRRQHHHGRGPGQPALSPDQGPQQAGRARRRPVPAHRHLHLQLHPLERPQHLRPDPVRQRIAPPPHLHDLPLRQLPPRLRHPALGPADAGQPELVPGHGRRRPAEPRLHRGPRGPRPHPLRRPPLPDGLPQVRRLPHRPSGAEISIAVTPVAAEQAREFGVMKVDRRRPHHRVPREAQGPGRRSTGCASTRPSSPASGTPASGRTHLASMGVYLFNQSVLPRPPGPHRRPRTSAGRSSPRPSASARSAATSSTATGRTSGPSGASSRPTWT